MSARLLQMMEDSDPHQEEIDVVIVMDDVLPPSVENDDSDGEVDAVVDLRVDNFIQNSEHEYSESEMVLFVLGSDGGVCGEWCMIEMDE
nr:hypothetical protein [Tanacetum cinerariifolium]